MRALALLACLVVCACAGGHGASTISANGVRLLVPPGWQRVPAADPGAVIDPRTLLVVGTKAVRPRSSRCQIASYRVQPRGAVVVVVGWRSLESSGGGSVAPGRAPLRQLTSVRRPSFECFAGRGAAAFVLLRHRPYQVNVLVGNQASRQLVSEALAAARSFDLSR